MQLASLNLSAKRDNSLKLDHLPASFSSVASSQEDGQEKEGFLNFNTAKHDKPNVRCSINTILRQSNNITIRPNKRIFEHDLSDQKQKKGLDDVIKGKRCGFELSVADFFCFLKFAWVLLLVFD